MRRVLYRWFLVGFLAVMLLISPTPLWAEESLTLSIGIVPQQNATKLARLWTPICNYLSQQTGYRFVFKTAKDIPTFENRLAAGEYDIAYMNPYHYTVFSIDPGYRAFARETNKRIQGIIVVKKDSAYQSIAELSGKTLAFPAPAAFAAHPRLSAAVVKHTADALIAMSTDEEGGKLLKNLNFNPIGPARDEDWDDVRGLGIALL